MYFAYAMRAALTSLASRLANESQPSTRSEPHTKYRCWRLRIRRVGPVDAAQRASGGQGHSMHWIDLRQEPIPSASKKGRRHGMFASRPRGLAKVKPRSGPCGPILGSPGKGVAISAGSRFPFEEGGLRNSPIGLF